MENNRPEYLYRGMCIRYEELKDFKFTGVDMELPYDPYIDDQGKETTRDGNEYGIYMSDNYKVAQKIYGNTSNKEDGTYIEPKVSLGNRGNDYIKIPMIGICYKIDTKGLNIRKPWISNELQGVYNNGLVGDEWIADRIPAENYELMSVQIGKDLLHDEQFIDLTELANINEKIAQILEQRKSRLETFAQEMAKIPEQRRREFGAGHIEILKEIYGEKGFYYNDNIDDIDTSSNIGMIRYLMANVYQNNSKDIDFDTLLFLQNIKEKVEYMNKKGKEFDLKEYLLNQSKNNSNCKKVLAILSQHDSRENTEAIIVDYYEKYGIRKDEDWHTIKEKLKNEQKIWVRRSSAANDKDILADLFQRIDEISDALVLFKPGHEERRKQYDAKLEQQKRRLAKDNNIGKTNMTNIIASIKNNNISKENLMEAIHQIDTQIKSTDRSNNITKQKDTNQEEIDN